MVERALILDPGSGTWSHYRRPVQVVAAMEIDRVCPVLGAVEHAVEERGLTAIGFVAFEAAPAFDPAHRVLAPVDGLPLACFGLFEAGPGESEVPAPPQTEYSVGPWTASQDSASHRKAIVRIRDRIAAGDTYQVNHTMRLRAPFTGDGLGFFGALVRSQPRSYAAYLDLGRFLICSASPELMLDLNEGRVVSRPMKGTADRGHDLVSDRAAFAALRASEKDRAENAMIVDMVRNDLGRVAEVGSVRVSRRFEVERHPTVLQMTSTVVAETEAGFSRLVGALFPYASVTGAPKIRTMELISELEDSPRGIYTGAIGIVRPGRRARFAVAIRTAVIDRTAGQVEYGVGSGVVWDSSASGEYDECRTKARVLSEPAPEFELLETLLWEPGYGFFLLDRHLDRLQDAAEYFGRPFDREQILKELGGTCSSGPLRVRLLVAEDGSPRVESDPIATEPDPSPVRLGLAVEPVANRDPFLHFKTSRRGVYEQARKSRPDCDDVVLWNQHGEVTESTIANLVVRLDGELVTPPVSSGLLAGTYRAELLESGEITERVVRVEDLQRADELYLINSVQHWREVEWVEG